MKCINVPVNLLPHQLQVELDLADLTCLGCLFSALCAQIAKQEGGKKVSSELVISCYSLAVEIFLKTETF